MNWTYGGVRIFTQEFGEENKQIISRLHPFAGGSIHHIFGWEDDVGKLEAYVVGSGDINTLVSYTKTESTYQLDSPYGTQGNYLLATVDRKLVNSICQTLRSDLPEDAPLYKVNLELYEDV